MIYLKRLKIKELFFPVNQSPLRAIIDNAMVNPPHYKVLHHKQFFLGIRPNDAEKEQVFCLNHQTVFNCGKMVADSIFPDLNAHIPYANPIKNKAFVFFGKQDFEKGVYSKENKEYVDESDTLEQKENLFNNYNRGLLKKLRYFEFEPSIVTENGFDYNDQTVFYLLVSLPFDYGVRGYLTLSRYRFSNKIRTEIAANPPGRSEDIAMHYLKTECVKEFLEDLDVFVNKLEVLSKISANPKELTAVALDVFNKNRNAEAIKSSEDLKRDLQKFIRSADLHFSRKNRMSDLINFIISTHRFDFGEEHLSLTAFKDILREKKAYSNLKRIYAGKNKKEEERLKYIKAQVKAKERIPE